MNCFFVRMLKMATNVSTLPSVQTYSTSKKFKHISCGKNFMQQVKEKRFKYIWNSTNCVEEENYFTHKRCKPHLKSTQSKFTSDHWNIFQYLQHLYAHGDPTGVVTLAFKKAVSDDPPCSGILDFASRRWKLATWACPPEKTSNSSRRRGRRRW